MRHLTATAVAAAACLLLGCASTMAQPPTAEVTKIDNPAPAGAQSAAMSQLATREGRMSVQPLDWDATRGEVSAQALESLEVSATPPGPPGSTPGGPPDPAADAEAESLHEADWQGLSGPQAFAAPEEGINFGTQDVFTQYREANLNYPQRAIGKLFTAGGTCSASVISGANVIVTAAHCCYDRSANDWIGGWSFAPAYLDGFAPFGLFDWSSAAVLTSWVNVGDRRSDVCVIKLRNDLSGHGVTFYTGWLGRSWNFSTTQVHHALGYPGNLGGGNKLELCVSESFNPNAGCGGATVLNTGCSMTFGSSGGPWVRHYRSGNWVNSVVSGYDGGACTGSFGGTFNGPRFTSNNIFTLCNAIGC